MKKKGMERKAMQRVGMEIKRKLEANDQRGDRGKRNRDPRECSRNPGEQRRSPRLLPSRKGVANADVRTRKCTMDIINAAAVVIGGRALGLSLSAVEGNMKKFCMVSNVRSAVIRGTILHIIGS